MPFLGIGTVLFEFYAKLLLIDGKCFDLNPAVSQNRANGKFT